MVVDRVNLTSVAVVCRYVEAMSGADGLVSDFLDASVLWTMRSAVERSSCGTVRLLERIAAREDPQMDPLLKRANFTQCLDKAVHMGNFEVVKWIVETYLPNGRIRNPVYTAVKRSRLEILQWLRANHDERVVWEPSMLIQEDSRSFSDLRTLKWLHENVVEVDDTMKRILMGNAVRFQLVDRVAWLYSIDLPFMQPDLSLAVRIGSIPIVEWIRDHTDTQFPEELMEEALNFGRIAMTQWFFTNCGFSMVTGRAIADAIRLHMDRSSSRVHEFLGWALKHLTITNNEGLADAVDQLSEFGDLEDVEKVHEVAGDGLCSTRAMNAASSRGRLEVVQWLHANRSEGCTPEAMDQAAANGHLDVVAFLHENRNEGCTSAAIDKAAESGHLEIVQWLHQFRSEGCTTKAMNGAATNGHLETLIWLHHNRTEGCTTRAMDCAAEGGHLEIVEWLGQNRSEGCTVNAMDMAALQGHIDIVNIYTNIGVKAVRMKQ